MRLNIECGGEGCAPATIRDGWDERYFRTHRKGDVTHGAGFELSVSHIELAGTFAMTPHVPPAELEFIHEKSLTSIQIHKRLEAQRAKKNIAAPHLTTAVPSQCGNGAPSTPRRA